MRPIVAWFVAWFVALCCSCVVLLLPLGAHAAPNQGTSHTGQFGLRIGLGVPFKMNFRYTDSPPCGTSTMGEPKNVCPVSSPVALDFALSYGVTSALEPFIWYRNGLAQERDTNTEAVSILGAGARIYTSASVFKFFLQPAVAVEIEGAVIDTLGFNYDTDFIAQLLFGGQYDFARYIGAYAALGPSVSFLRSLSLGLEGTFGVQGRFP
jgi:hypothetical protein